MGAKVCRDVKITRRRLDGYQRHVWTMWEM